MTMQRFLGLATTLLATALLAGCGGGDRKPGDTVEREGEPPVSYVADDDAKMLAAIEKARSTVDRFIAALDDPKPAQSFFSVKIPVKDGDHVEHMWITPVRYENDRFFGVINNEPDMVETVEIGDEVDVAKDEISDWMFVEDGKLMGGYTLRVLRDGSSAEDREAFDRSVPFTID